LPFPQRPTVEFDRRLVATHAAGFTTGEKYCRERYHFLRVILSLPAVPLAAFFFRAMIGACIVRAPTNKESGPAAFSAEKKMATMNASRMR
jgi:hypothetical protein